MNTDLFKFKFSKLNASQGSFADIYSSDTVKFSLDDNLFKELRDFIYNQCGIYYTENKKYLLEGRLVKRLASLNQNSFVEYMKLLRSPSGREELNNLFEVITINETYFFRAEPQFQAFESIVAPEILESKKNEIRPVLRIWSAASSSGEEAYTTAIICLERLKKKYPNVQFQILASDISNTVLSAAKKGIYKDYAIRNVPPDILSKYFIKSGGAYTLSDEVKNLVKFMNINLYDQTAMSAITGCDVIFCCNALIYFDLQSKQQVISNLYKSLNPKGYLFIGYSESLHGVSKSFKLVHFPKAMGYKKDL